jgi:uncharacterized protein YcbK (DUF882 family)
MKYCFLSLIVILLCSCNSQSPEEKFDKESGQKEILSYAAIDSVYNSFETIRYDQLDTAYINYTCSWMQKKSLHNRMYLVVRGNDIYKFLVGKYRVKNFLARDKYYQQSIDNTSVNVNQYLLLDKKLLYMILDLVKMLDKYGYDKYGFTIRDGFRHPLANIGGAPFSQHLYGRATDIIIADVNKDGASDLKDKKIILDLLDTGIIKDRGGIGRYPGSDVVHFDIRGTKARWDVQ